MPFDFEELTQLEEEGEEAPVEDNAGAVLESIQDTFDEHMSEVEKRLEVASYYRVLLNDSLFTDGSEAARMVEKEVRTFIKQRLEVLLGMKAEKQQVVVESKKEFTDPEVAALKALAAKVIGKPALVETTAPKTPAKPEIKKAAAPAPAPKAPAAPIRRPAVAAKPPVARPAAKPPQAAPVPQQAQPKKPGKAKKDIMGQVRPAQGALPPPSRAQFEAMSQASATMMASSAAPIETNTDPKTAVNKGVTAGYMSGALAHSIQGGE
jgi:hypothetical protein